MVCSILPKVISLAFIIAASLPPAQGDTTAHPNHIHDHRHRSEAPRPSAPRLHNSSSLPHTPRHQHITSMKSAALHDRVSNSSRPLQPHHQTHVSAPKRQPQAIPISQLQRSRHVAQHSRSTTGSSARACKTHAQQADAPQRPAQQLASLCAAAAVTLSSCLGPVLLAPAAAEARPRMTAEEQVSVDVFKKSTPSVVNVTNLTARCVAV